ncbi:hypothetical protein NM208_g6126 [Fusarium decemcellulare]|uniref:Uncharacterized protein n=1 Tax=Fusarium decemcellulare TaxID=57161 RepID=A0ACC1SE93_9HYPO|nr:hypothetical protein NM208_g6126 [Fusarium decemcellulare]
MAQRRDKAFNAMSPHSEVAHLDSFQGTPDTRLSVFSPEAGPSKATGLGKGPSATPVRRSPANPYRIPDGMPQFDRDPFISPAERAGLSPTALTFKPIANKGKAPAFPLYQQSGTFASVLSSDMGISSLLEVSGLPHVSIPDVGNYLSDLVKKGAKLYGSRNVEGANGRVYVHFEDIRDAIWAFSALRHSTKGWVVNYLNVNQGGNGYELSGEEKLFHLGQVTVFASPPFGTVVDPNQVMEVAQKVLNAHGDLFALLRQMNYPDGSFRATAQYCKVQDAMSAVKACNGVTVDGIHFVVSAPLNAQPSATGGEDLASAMQGLSLVPLGNHRNHRVGAGGRTGEFYPQSAYPMHSFMFPPPSNLFPVVDRMPQVSAYGNFPMGAMGPNYPFPGPGPLYPPPSPAPTSRNGFSPSRGYGYGRGNGYVQGNGFGRFDTRRHPARAQRAPHRHVNNNIVDLNELIAGRDCRTTIMLRNIPNKVDQPMLKRIVDQSSYGKYDFMYLRIDFANDCNVGYAFINFAKAEYIIPFVQARANKRWNCFKSDKVAEVSYATVQGKDCLVQKFRNSSVMLEAQHYRPKLFYTIHHEDAKLVGLEEPFPGPDNQSKMKRSVENAEHVGLFTPNAGQHYRDEQRRRKSIYDRGTRLAALEEIDFESRAGSFYGRGMHQR